MDIFSIIVVCVALYGMAKRAPGLVGEAVAAWQAGQHGGTTPAADAAQQKLADAGVPPSTADGSLRQFLGNRWRGYWHDKDQDRQRQRALQNAAKDRSWWKRRMDAALDHQAGKYRGNPDPKSADDTPGDRRRGREYDIFVPESLPLDPDDDIDEQTFSDDETPNPDRPDAGRSEDSPTGPPQSDPGQDPDGSGGDWQNGPPYDQQRDDFQPGGGNPEPTDTRPPIRVNATVGQPVRDRTGTATAVLDPPDQQIQIEGNPHMGNAVATNGTPITGVVSGSYEMLSIHKQLEAAVQAFTGQLAAIQNRLNRAGDSTIGVVQLANGSTVMVRMAQAAEAVAALRGAAAGCSAEVSPLLLQTKAEFDRRNS